MLKLRLNPGRLMSTHQIGKLFGKAHVRAATMETAIHGFRKTRMFPPNRNIFRDYDFASKISETACKDTVKRETALKRHVVEFNKRKENVCHLL